METDWSRSKFENVELASGQYQRGCFYWQPTNISDWLLWMLFRNAKTDVKRWKTRVKTKKTPTFFNQFQGIKDFLFFKLFRFCTENYVGLRVLFAFFSVLALNRQIKELHQTNTTGSFKKLNVNTATNIARQLHIINTTVISERRSEDLIKQFRVQKKCKTNLLFTALCSHRP